jgi:hypothetical protein
MDENLVQAVRVRLERTATDELLQFWTENDRERYSEEAFEAARLILIARGLTPPQQRHWTGPVPVATKAASLDPSSHEFWNAWLRPLLWAAFAVGGVRCLYLALWAVEILRTDATPSPPSVHSFSSLVAAVQSPLNFILPPALLVAALLSFGLRATGRTILVVWCWTEVTSCAVSVFQYGVEAAFIASGVLDWAAWTIYEAQGYVTFAAFALILLFFITRPQIKRLFDAPSWGFDLNPAETVEHNAGEAVLTGANPTDQPPCPHDHQ